MPRPLCLLSLPTQILSALTKAGYEYVEDIKHMSAQELAAGLKLSFPDSEMLNAAISQTPASTPALPSLTQSAASMTVETRSISSGSPPVDDLLSGGLSRGNILEIYGPPGSCKERIAINFVKSFLELNEKVLFVDLQNMTCPALLKDELEASKVELVSFAKLHTLPELMIFLRNLSKFLTANPKTSLLVLNSISFPFQAPEISKITKNTCLDQIKKILARVCNVFKLTVVLTSQLAVKILNSDGRPGNFDTGVRGVMGPPLGDRHLPAGLTYSIIVVPDSLTTGTFLLHSMPITQKGKNTKLEQRYCLAGKGLHQQILRWSSDRASPASGSSRGTS